MAMALLASSGLGVVIVASSAQAVPSVSASQPSPTKNSPVPQDQQRRTNPVRRMVGGYSGTRGDGRRAGPGWTNKHAQRLAKKAQNVKRSRKGSR